MNAPLPKPILQPTLPREDKWLNGAAAVVTRAADDLAHDNAAARREQDKRDWATLRALIERHGVSNVVGIMADEVADMADERDALADADYELAAEILTAACEGVDLAYGNQPTNHVRVRVNALKNFQIAAMKVRA